MHNDQPTKGLFAPPYYHDFTCIADRCRHSCCIDWEIGIDEATYTQYRQMGDILPTIQMCEDVPCFALREDGRCPHLNDDGLCRIILSHGEEYLSEICQNHPRFYNNIHSERTEVGLGLVCEEACRLILENETPFSLSKIDDLDGEEMSADEITFDPLPTRDRIIAVIEEPDRRFDETLAALQTAYKISDRRDPDKWLDRLLLLEILDPAWERDLISMKGRLHPTSAEHIHSYDTYYKRLLTYFVYRHVSVAADPEDLRARLAFAILSVEMIRAFFEADISQPPTLNPAGVPEKLIDWSRRYSAEIEYSEDNTDELIFGFVSGCYD